MYKVKRIFFSLSLLGILVLLLTSWFVVFHFVPSISAVHATASWLTGWGYRQSHLVQNATGAGTNYQIPIIVGYNSSFDTSWTIGAWTAETPLPVTRADMPGVVWNGSFYIFGGYNDSSNGGGTNTTYAYNPATNAWTQKSSMAYARWGGAAAVYNNISYVFGGYTTTYNNKVEAYNFTTDSWATKNNLPANLSGVGSGLEAVTVGSLIYLFSGNCAYSYNASADSYSQLKSNPQFQKWATCAYVNVAGEDRIYIIGGWTSTTALSTVYYYRPTNNDWTLAGSGPYAAYGVLRDNPVINGTIYYGFGHASSSFYAYLYSYTPSTGAWRLLQAATYPRDGVASGVINSRLYVVGGRSGLSSPILGLNYTEQFDPVGGFVGRYTNTGGKCQSSFGDVRFTASDGTTLLNYWMQEETDYDHAFFWVNDPDNLTSANSTIYMYYGNSTVTTTSNGTATWLLFDDFEGGSSDLGNYNVDSGSISDFAVVPFGSTGNSLKFSGSSGWDEIYRTGTSFLNFRMLAREYISVTQQLYYGGFSFRRTASNNWYFGMFTNDSGYAGSPGGMRFDWDKRISGTDANIASSQTQSLNASWSNLEMDLNGTVGTAYLNNTMTANGTGTGISSASSVGFVSYHYGSIYWDNLAFGKYVNPEPAQSGWGVEETSGPNPRVSISPSSAALDVGRSQQFTSNVSAGTPPYSFQWYLNDAPVSGATSGNWTFTPTSPGSYTVYVKVNDAVGIKATSSIALVGVGAGIHDVAVTNITSSKTVVGQGYSVNVSITVQNQGDFTETFNLTAFANATLAASQNVTLPSGSSTSINLTWNTTGFPYGNYTINGYSWPVPGETNTANNNCTCCNVVVTIPGDINGDGKVGLSDLTLLASAYGSRQGDTRWSPNADINDEGTISLSDLTTLAQHYRQHYP